MSLLGCRFVKWSAEKKAVTSVSAEFVWRNKWMESECDQDMRKRHKFFASPFMAMPQVSLTSRVVANAIALSYTFEAPEPHTETSPAETCKCGFYNFRDLRSAGIVMTATLMDGVMLVTESAGKIIMHDRGFRSQYCRPVGVVFPFTYKMESRSFRQDDVVIERHLRNGPDGLWQDAKAWVKDQHVRIEHGYTLSDDSIMVAQKLRIPVIAPWEVTNMIRNSWMENNLA